MNCSRVTINGTEAIMAGPKIVEAIEFKNTSTKRCSTFNTPTGIIQGTRPMITARSRSLTIMIDFFGRRSR